MAAAIRPHPVRADRALEATILRLLRRHDPRIRVRYPRTGKHREQYTWNGATCTLVTAGDTYESCLHDVAHWLVATPEQRACHEFGLGPDPYRESDATAVVTDREGGRIEARTCDVQIALVLALDLDTDAVTRETNTPLPSPAKLRRTRRKYPDAMPAALWKAAENRLATARFHAAQARVRDEIYALEAQIQHTDARIAAEQRYRDIAAKLLATRRAELQSLLEHPPTRTSRTRA